MTQNTQDPKSSTWIVKVSRLVRMEATFTVEAIDEETAYEEAEAIEDLDWEIEDGCEEYEIDSIKREE